MGEESFSIERFFSKSIFCAITETRVEHPQVILSEAMGRRLRKRLTRDGRLVIVAADHPGRGATHSGTDPLGMADRYEFLGRILRVLQEPGVDGVMATPDVLDELFIAQHLIRQSGGRAYLDHRVMIGCMNRGGISGSVFELRDRFGAYTAQEIRKMRLDGAKLMFRLDWQSAEAGATLQDCALALRQLDRLGLPAFLEPLAVEATGSGFRVSKQGEPLMRVIGIATALGNSTRRMWLKIPYVKDYARVAHSTTCPILMLGGEAHGDPRRMLEDFAAGLTAAPNVRGVLVGRNVLYPGNADPAAMAAAVARIVHEGLDPREAHHALQEPVSVAPLVSSP